MKRPFLLPFATAALLMIAVGAWIFAKTAPIYAWYAVLSVLVLISQLYIFMTLFLAVLGK